MTIIRSLMAVGFLSLALTGANAKTTCDSSSGKVGDNKVFMDVTSGCIVIQLLPKLAPGHVKRITTLTKKGFYDGIVFHRVIDGFMAQTGDPTGTGAGGSKLPDLKAEFTQEPFVRGVLGMARSSNPDSANSQFFIMFGTASSLNGQYTVLGKVESGMEHVDAIKKGKKSANGSVTKPDKIIKMQLSTGS